MWKQAEEMSFQDYTGAEYSTFNDAINILKDLNNLLPEVIANYKRSSIEVWVNKFKNLNEEGWKELNSVLKNPLDDSLTLTDHTAIDIYCSGIGRLIAYPLKMGRLIREMTLVYLISTFEAYLENIISLILSKSPEILRTEKTITHREVMEIAIRNGTMEDLINSLKDKYINSIMGKDINDILETLTSQPFKLLEIKPKSSEWRRLKESFYRRHVIIHNRGCVDSKYATKSGYKGQRRTLFIDKKYLAKRFETFQRCSGIIRDSANDKFGNKKSEKQHDQAAISFNIFEPT
jgi:hypothetical protein